MIRPWLRQASCQAESKICRRTQRESLLSERRPQGYAVRIKCGDPTLVRFSASSRDLDLPCDAERGHRKAGSGGVHALDGRGVGLSQFDDFDASKASAWDDEAVASGRTKRRPYRSIDEDDEPISINVGERARQPLVTIRDDDEASSPRYLRWAASSAATLSIERGYWPTHSLSPERPRSGP
jgi:hypothetical protein